MVIYFKNPYENLLSQQRDTILDDEAPARANGSQPELDAEESSSSSGPLCQQSGHADGGGGGGGRPVASVGGGVQLRQAAGPAAPTLQIRKTLNNVSIVNNITQPFAGGAPGGGGGGGGGASGTVVPVAAAGQGGVHHNSIMLPMGLMNPMCVGNGIMPMMVTTPLLLPQVNGPTLLVNVPNYVTYSGIATGMSGVVMPGMFGNMAVVASVNGGAAGGQAATPQPAGSGSSVSVGGSPTVDGGSKSETAPAARPPSASSLGPSCSSQEGTSTRVKDRKSLLKPEAAGEKQVSDDDGAVLTNRQVSASPKPGPSRLKDELAVAERLAKTPSEEADAADAQDGDIRCLEASDDELPEARPKDEPEQAKQAGSRDSSEPSAAPERLKTVISHADASYRQADGEEGGASGQEVSAIQSVPKSSVGPVQDSLLAANQEECPNPLLGGSSSSLECPANADSKPFTFSQFGSESAAAPLPQLTLNFPSILPESHPSVSPADLSTTSRTTSSTPPVSGNGGGSSSGSSSTSSSVIVTAGSGAAKASQPEVGGASVSLASQQLITVDTVEALQSALACNNDVQLVVSNELLETSEFRALMHNMVQQGTTAPGPYGAVESLEATPLASPIPPPEEESVDSVKSDSYSSSSTFRPLDDTLSTEPLPCSSRDMSREATRQGFESGSVSPGLPLNPASDDDITLQVASF